MTKSYYESSLLKIPGYDALRRFEARVKVYDIYHEQKVIEDQRERARRDMEDQRERARRELDRKRRCFDYWTSLSPGEFEHEVAELFKKHRYDTRVTPGSGDGGVDIVLTKHATISFVQCKRYKSKVGPAPIRELYGVMVAHGVKSGIVVCPAGFTAGAWKFSKRKNIRLIGLKRLIELNDPEDVATAEVVDDGPEIAREATEFIRRKTNIDYHAEVDADERLLLEKAEARSEPGFDERTNLRAFRRADILWRYDGATSEWHCEFKNIFWYTVKTNVVREKHADPRIVARRIARQFKWKPGVCIRVLDAETWTCLDEFTVSDVE